MTFPVLILCALVVAGLFRLLAVMVALKGVPSRRRAEVLKALSFVFGTWPRL